MRHEKALTLNVYITLLRYNRNYRNLWLARVVSNLGDWFNLLASATLSPAQQPPVPGRTRRQQHPALGLAGDRQVVPDQGYLQLTA